MNGRIVRVRELCPDDEAAWRALASRAIEPNPLYEPDCLIPAALHQGFGEEIHVVFAEEEGRIFGCIPVRQVGRWHSFPYPFVTTQVRRMIYCGTPLVDPERGDEAMAAIFSALAERRGLWRGRVLVLQELTEGGPVDHAVHQAVERMALPLHRFEAWQRGVLLRREDANYAGLQNGKFRKGIRRCHRQLGERLGAEARVVDRSDDPTAIDDYIELEASGYKRGAGVALATVPGEPEYFRDMCWRYAKQGRLRVLSLEGGGTTVAMLISLRGGEGMFGIKVSYDEQFSRFAPGVQLHLASMERFHHTSDAQWMDTCTTGTREILLKLYPDRRRITSYFVPLSRNPLDGLAVRLFMTLRPLHKRCIDFVSSRRRGAEKGSATCGEPSSTGGSGPAGSAHPPRSNTAPTAGLDRVARRIVTPRSPETGAPPKRSPQELTNARTG